MKAFSCFLLVLLLQPTKVQNQQLNTLQAKQSSRTDKEINEVGSRPPRCEHKCYGCRPCVAAQVPTKAARVGVQYTNYEPEGWMCKCGPTFYSP